jgi:hypothetical protein
MSPVSAGFADRPVRAVPGERVDGETAVLSGDVQVTVTDDASIVLSGTSSSGSVDEGGLVVGKPGDLYGTGNDHGTATTAAGTLSGLVHFGADGPAASGGFSFVDAATATTWLTNLGLHSHGFLVNSASINGNTLTASDSNGDNVFTLTLDPLTGNWTFTLLNPIDDLPIQGDNTSSIDL